MRLSASNGYTREMTTASSVPSSGPAGSSQPEQSYTPAYQTVAKQLVDLIRSEGHRPGDRLPTELELAHQLGVGRGIVREAIKVLSAVGLVRARRGSGIYVGSGTSTFLSTLGGIPSATDPQQVGQLFEFRLLQETAAARMAAEHITVKTLRRLEEALTANVAGLEKEDRALFQRGDRDFHVTMGEASGNSFVAASVQQVMDLQIWAVAMIVGDVGSSRSTAAEQHRAIFDAIRGGLAEEAARATEVHIKSSRADYERAVHRILDERLR